MLNLGFFSIIFFTWPFSPISTQSFAFSFFTTPPPHEEMSKATHIIPIKEIVVLFLVNSLFNVFIIIPLI